MRRFSTINLIGIVVIFCGIIYSITIAFHAINTLTEQAQNNFKEKSIEQLNYFKSEFETETNKIESTVDTFQLNISNMYREHLNNNSTLDDLEISIVELFTSYLISDTAVSNSIYVYFDPELDGDVHDVWLTNNTFVKREDEVPLESYLSQDNMNWFFDVKNSEDARWIKPYRNRYNAYVTSYVMPLIYEGEFIGIVGMYLDINQLSKLLSTLNHSKEDIFWITDKDNIILYHPYYEVGASLNNTKFNIDFNRSFSIDSVDDHTYWHFIDTTVNDWTFIHTVDTSIILNNIDFIAKEIFMSSIIYIVSILFIFIVLKRKIYAILMSVINSIKFSHVGDYSHLLPTSKNYEINLLSEALNTSFKYTREELDKLKYIAYFDRHSDIPNKNGLDEDYAFHLSGENLSLFLIKMDQIEVLKKLIGKTQYETLLIEVAEKLKTLMNESTKLYSISCDEYVIIQTNHESITDTSESILKLIETTNFESARKMLITCSIGISKSPSDGKYIKDLVSKAQIAIEEAHLAGGNQYKFYSRFTSKLDPPELIHAIKKSIVEEEFKMVYQPFYNSSKDLLGYEAFIRWVHPEKGIIKPEAFLDLAEQTGQIIEIGDTVFKMVFSDIQLGKHLGASKKIRINVSIRQFLNPGFVPSTLSAIRQYKIDPNLIILELESHYIEYDLSRTIKKINSLSTLGIQFSINSLGLGNRTLKTLADMPIKYVTIRPELISKLQSEATRALVRSIIKFSHDFDYEVFGVGIEEEDEYRILKELGCDYFQGYYFSKESEL